MLDFSARIDGMIDRSELIASTGRLASMVVVESRIDSQAREEAVQYEVATAQRVLRTTKVSSADVESRSSAPTIRSC